MYRIIAADDEPMMRKGLRALVDWTALDCTLVDVAENGDQALDAVLTQQPDILICDIRMPGKSGIEVAREIYTRRLPVKMILLTAYADFSYARQAIQYGVSDYVTKTGALDGIVEAVRKCTAQLAQERTEKTAGDGEAASFLKSVIDGTLFEQNRILEYADALCLDLSHYTLLAAVLSDAAEDAEAARLTESARRMLSELTDLYPCHIIPLGKARLCAVLCGASPEALLEPCRSLAKTFEAFCGGRLYIGLSRTEHSPLSLPQALARAEQALGRSFFERSASVFRWTAEPELVSAGAVAEAEAAARSLCAAEESASEAALAHFLTRTREQGCSSELVRGDGLFLVSVCRKQLLLSGLDAEEIAPLCTEAERAVRDCRFWEDYCTCLSHFVQACRNRLTDRVSANAGTIAAAQAFIDRNFERAVTLGEIAAAAGANPSYLSRTFKSKTGMSIVDTLNARRMEKAKELLRAGQLKIYEIAQSIGIEDTTYFSHLFRRYTGVSPKAYQSACLPDGSPEDAE